MNRFVAVKEDGSRALVMVLEPGNIARLTEGQPITLNLEEMFPSASGIPPRLQLVIDYSETPVADAREIARETGATVTDTRTPRIAKAKPHCPQCKSTVEQLGAWTSAESPVALFFCVMCGATLGTVAASTMPRPPEPPGRWE